MLRQAQVALGARAHRGGHGVNVGNMDEESARSCDGVVQAVELGAGRRALAFLVAVLSEFLSWWAILLAGVLFAFTSETTDLVIRSAVSVMFVLNVDEIVFSACCPEAIADNMAATNYLVTPLASFVVRQKHWVSLRTYRYRHKYIYTCIHVYIIYMYYVYIGEPPHLAGMQSLLQPVRPPLRAARPRHRPHNEPARPRPRLQRAPPLAAVRHQ